MLTLRVKWTTIIEKKDTVINGINIGIIKFPNRQNSEDEFTRQLTEISEIGIFTGKDNEIWIPFHNILSVEWVK
jgi:hypothetical protein